MALPARTATTVNAQIVDAVTTSNVSVIGEAPGFAMGTVYQSAAQSASRLLQNNAAAQQSLQQVGIAVVSTAVAQILSMAGNGSSGGGGSSSSSSSSHSSTSHSSTSRSSST